MKITDNPRGLADPGPAQDEMTPQGVFDVPRGLVNFSKPDEGLTRASSETVARAGSGEGLASAVSGERVASAGSSERVARAGSGEELARAGSG